MVQDWIFKPGVKHGGRERQRGKARLVKCFKERARRRSGKKEKQHSDTLLAVPAERRWRNYCCDLESIACLALSLTNRDLSEIDLRETPVVPLHLKNLEAVTGVGDEGPSEGLVIATGRFTAGMHQPLSWWQRL